MLLLYGVFAFGAYALWCETVRGVDPGLGDSWVVPVSNGYTFNMGDLTDKGYLRGPSGEQLQYGIERLGAAGDVVAFESDGNFYIFNTRTRTPQAIASESLAIATLRASHGTDSSLLEPNTFYLERRWGPLDMLAFIVISLPPAAAILLLSLAFRRSLRPIGG